MLGVKRARVKKKECYPKGITATAPDQIWHADITVVKSLDGIKNYVYLLMDNFSRYIINWRVEPVVTGAIRTQTIKSGYRHHIHQSQNVQLIMDGGPENNNGQMDAFINSSEL